MKNNIVLIAFLVSGFNLFAQQPIELIKKRGTFKFTQGDKNLKLAEVSKLLENNTKALNFFSKAKTNNVVATLLGGVGGALIGFPIGTAISGGVAQWELAGVGAGLALLGIPFNNGFKKNAKMAIDLYNAPLVGNLEDNSPTFNINLKPNGFAVAINF